jgi:putative two-component system response regulator
MDLERTKATIMVVDDTPSNLKLLEEMLRADNYRVVAFPRGDLALKAAVKSPPDLILLDINMPEMNGFEVCERLKADEGLREIPVIFISALAEARDKVRAFAAGGVDYVTKPFHFEELKARTTTHLHLRKLRMELEKHNRQLEEAVRDKVREISDSQLATISALAKLAESRDDDTGQHIERTQTYCRLIITKLKAIPRYAGRIDDKYVDNIFHAAPLHDIGKVGIKDKILLKPGKLDLKEFEVMKTHAMIGAQTLQMARNMYPNNAFLNTGIAIARSHHEKWDGSGYPDGLVGEDIPLCARVMCVADVYDALRSKRPYKPVFSHNEACRIIKDGSGRHFDPLIIETFCTVEPEISAISKKISAGKFFGG